MAVAVNTLDSHLREQVYSGLSFHLREGIPSLKIFEKCLNAIKNPLLLVKNPLLLAVIRDINTEEIEQNKKWKEKGEYVPPLLLDNKKEIAELLKTHPIDPIDGKEVSPLQVAVVRNNLPLVLLLLDSGADINRTCALDKTALHFAVETKNAEMVEFLLEQDDIDINYKGSGPSALELTIEIGFEAGQKLINEANIQKEKNLIKTYLKAIKKLAPESPFFQIPPLQKIVLGYLQFFTFECHILEINKTIELENENIEFEIDQEKGIKLIKQ